MQQKINSKFGALLKFLHHEHPTQNLLEKHPPWIINPCAPAYVSEQLEKEKPTENISQV